MQRQVLISTGLILVLMVGGFGAAAWLISQKPETPDVVEERPPLVVRAVALAPTNVTEEIVGFGTAVADRYAWVSPEVSGYVESTVDDLRSGASVQAGTDAPVLIKLEDREYREQAERAGSLLRAEEARLASLNTQKENIERLIAISREELELAQREFERVQALFEKGLSGQRELDGTRLLLESARSRTQTLENQLLLWPRQVEEQTATVELRRAELALARINLERCLIRPPFDGRLDAVNVEVGEWVSPGQRLFSILDPDRIEVPVDLPVSRRGAVHAGTACRLTLESRDDVVWRGVVARIAPTASEATRTFKAFVEVDNHEQSEPLVPGMFVRAAIDGPTLQRVLTIPRGVIQDDAVYVCVDNTARQRPVAVDRQLAHQTVITGLQPGDIVITSNLDALHEGLRVEPRLIDSPPASITARETGGEPPRVAPEPNLPTP